jgi:hypothetical protein
MMNITQRMECLSRAYVQAVAAYAGFQVSKPDVDDDSIDGIIMSRIGKRPRIEFQLKATSQDVLKVDHVAFPLPIKNYDDLRVETITARILIVLVMPENEVEWLECSQDALSLRRCAYWHTLSGKPETSNSTTVTVHLPRSQMFTPDGLTAMMRRIQAGTMP